MMNCVITIRLFQGILPVVNVTKIKVHFFYRNASQLQLDYYFEVLQQKENTC